MAGAATTAIGDGVDAGVATAVEVLATDVLGAGVVAVVRSGEGALVVARRTVFPVGFGVGAATATAGGAGVVRATNSRHPASAAPTMTSALSPTISAIRLKRCCAGCADARSCARSLIKSISGRASPMGCAGAWRSVADGTSAVTWAADVGSASTTGASWGGVGADISGGGTCGSSSLSVIEGLTLQGHADGADRTLPDRSHCA